MFLSKLWKLLQVCVCVSTAPGVCVCVCVCTWMGQIQRTHFTAGYTLYNCVCDQKKICYRFFLNRYPIMVKCLKIGKPIYRLISSFSSCSVQLCGYFTVLLLLSVSTGHVYGGGEGVQHWAGHCHAAEQTEGDRWSCPQKTRSRLRHLCTPVLSKYTWTIH